MLYRSKVKVTQPEVNTPRRAVEEWMFICQQNGDGEPDISTKDDFDWTVALQSYPNLEETPTFFSRQ